MELVGANNNVRGDKKNISFQVTHVLEKKLVDTAWRKRMTLSNLLRGYCEDCLFREKINERDNL